MWVYRRHKSNLKEYWHSWFAWYPVSVEMAEGGNAWAIWHEVERREVYGYGGPSWRYREKIEN